MPYIKGERRLAIKAGGLPETPGELNYKLTLDIIEYANVKGLNYTTINDILGALRGCEMEFYGRIASKYEKGKKNENGDVYNDLRG